MTSRLKKLSAFIGAGLTGATLLVSAPMASAATWDEWMYTDDGDPGGVIRFKAYGDRVQVCDIQADGYGVIGWIDDGYGSGPNRVYVGGYGSCKTVDASTSGGKYNQRENTWVHFEVCLTNSSHTGWCDEAGWWNG
jgi:hypothetical protein